MKLKIHDDTKDIPYPPNNHNSDPVVEYKSLWYFWDELWMTCYGPLPSEKAARAALKYYTENYV